MSSKLTAEGALELYLDNLETRNYAPSTLKSYRYLLTVFIQYLKRHGIKLHKVTIDTILEYQQHVNKTKSADGKKWSEGYKLDLILVVRRLFTHLHEHQLILINPCDGLPQMKFPKPLPKDIMTREEIGKLLAAPDTHKLMGFRDRAIFEVLFATAIRPSSLCGLTVYDPDLKSGLLRVQKTKSKREQVVPLSKVACNYVKEYIDKIRPSLNKKNSDILFLTPQGTQLQSHTLRNMMKRYVRKAGVREILSPYSWRRTCATEMLRGGSSVIHVGEMLSHMHLSTTQVYLRLAPSDLKKVMEDHPRETMKVKGEPVFSAKKEDFYWQYKQNRQKRK